MVFWLSACASATPDSPPFNGTIFVDADIITSGDPSAYTSLKYVGRAVREMFDRRTKSFSEFNAFLFIALYDDGLEIEIQQSYIDDGILEETLVHEATHSSMDPSYSTADSWVAAQNADSRYISTYAQQHPEREDLAETFLLYLAVKYREDRIENSVVDAVQKAVPARIAFFDGLNLNLYPFEPVQ